MSTEFIAQSFFDSRSAPENLNLEFGDMGSKKIGNTLPSMALKLQEEST